VVDVTILNNLPGRIYKSMPSSIFVLSLYCLIAVSHGTGKYQLLKYFMRITSKIPTLKFIKVSSKPTPDKIMPAVAMLLLCCRLTVKPIARPMILTSKPA
jgi:hypothetical protein